MGYLLHITTEDGNAQFLGTKYYGYSFEMGYEATDIPSFRYLLDIGVAKTSDFFHESNIDLKYELTAEQFKEFITLYAKEWEEKKRFSPTCWPKERTLLKEKDIIELLKNEKSKILTWE